MDRICGVCGRLTPAGQCRSCGSGPLSPAERAKVVGTIWGLVAILLAVAALVFVAIQDLASTIVFLCGAALSALVARHFFAQRLEIQLQDKENASRLLAEDVERQRREMERHQELKQWVSRLSADEMALVRGYGRRWKQGTARALGNPNLRNHEFNDLLILMRRRHPFLSTIMLEELIAWALNRDDVESLAKALRSSRKPEGMADLFVEVAGANVESRLTAFTEVLRRQYPQVSADEVGQLVAGAQERVRLRRVEARLRLAAEESVQLSELDSLTGVEFEQWLMRALRSQGFMVTETPVTGDQGADLLLERNGRKIIVQAKRYAGSVGNAAIQEAVAAKNHYGADEAWVVTTGKFTKAAIVLAKSNQVRLVAREQLSENF